MNKVEDIVLNASQNYANAIGISIDQLIDHVLDLFKKGYGKEEVIEILSQVNLEQVMFKGAMVGAAVEELMGAYPKVLGSMEMTGKMNPKFLSALERTERASFIAYSRGIVQETRRRLMGHVLRGSSRKQMAYELYQSGVYSQREIVAHINTSLSNYSRSVTLKMSESDPSDKKYHYLGPLDERTRPICLEMLAAGNVELGDIDNLFPGSMSDGGGFNCRHRWTSVTEFSKHQAKTDKANNRVGELKRHKKWPNRVETLQTYYERRENSGI